LQIAAAIGNAALQGSDRLSEQTMQMFVEANMVQKPAILRSKVLHSGKDVKGCPRI
jgi:hypothetical protein